MTDCTDSAQTPALAFLLEHINIAFNGVSVLRDVSLALRKNEIHAIVGKNGAGKSTLMKVLTGVYRPDSGKIAIWGQELGGAAHSALKQGVAMVYQDLSLVPSMSVQQNIFLHSHPFRKWGLLQDGKARRAALDIFAFMGLDPGLLRPESLVFELSVGQAQLVEIAKALASRPGIVVFDEPTAALSDVETAQLFQTIRTLQQQGLAIIYITHYLEDVISLCDRITVLRDGQAVFGASIAETSMAEIVRNMLGAEQDSSPFQRTAAVAARASTAAAPSGSEALLVVEQAATERVGPVSLCARAGEVIGLAGLLGSGRTEILRLLYGLDALISGQVRIDGKTVRLFCPQAAMQYGISLVPEERRSQGLVLDFSLRHNLSLAILTQLRNGLLLNSRRELSAAQQAMQKLQIKAQGPNQAVRFLSGGNQQKVVFGKCLLAQPRILLLDDPTFGIDVHAKSEIMQLIADYAARGNTVLFVSSELGEIAQFCDRVYIVSKKRIQQELCRSVGTLNEAQLLRAVQ